MSEQASTIFPAAPKWELEGTSRIPFAAYTSEARAQAYGDSAAGDLKILNVALGLEHEAIAAPCGRVREQ